MAGCGSAVIPMENLPYYDTQHFSVDRGSIPGIDLRWRENHSIAGIDFTWREIIQPIHGFLT
jgi:hypothetical protein